MKKLDKAVKHSMFIIISALMLGIMIGIIIGML
jgi:hypothetical protein